MACVLKHISILCITVFTCHSAKTQPPHSQNNSDNPSGIDRHFELAALDGQWQGVNSSRTCWLGIDIPLLEYFSQGTAAI